MRTKANSVYDFTSQNSFDIYVLVETWLNADFFDGEYFNLNMFHIYRRDRDRKATGLTRGGGIIIAVRKNLKSKLLPLKNDSPLIEQVCISVNGLNKNLLLCVSYIPPESSNNLYLYHAENIVDIYEKNAHSNVCVMGDFNLKDVMWTKFPDSQLLLPCNVNHEHEITLIDSLLGIGLHQVNDLINKIGHILDLVFLDADSKCSLQECNFFISKPNIHHFALTIEIEFYKYENFNDSVNFNYNLCNFNEINNLISNIDWKGIFSHNLVNSYDIFLNNVTRILSENVPLVQPRIHKLPWYTRGLKKLKNLRNKYQKKYGSTNDELDKQRYDQYSREFNFLNKFLYKQYLLNVESSIKSNPKNFWQFVRSKKGTSSFPCSMTYKNEHVSNSLLDTANLFADFFRNNFVTHSQTPNIDNFGNITSFLDLGNFVVNMDDVLLALDNLNNSKKPDIDGLSQFFIKSCAQSMCTPLVLLFNESLRIGHFIPKWKTSWVEPIFKDGVKSKVENYRPICKLSNISKIFEHIICAKLSFLVKRYINPSQHGFVSGRSTTTNLAVFTKYCNSNLESGFQVDVIYTDLKKAFDRVSHDVLILKLSLLGIHSNLLNWLKSYLINRVCIVKIENITSYSYIAISGVPQGSVLGPLLFNLFINDIQFCFSHSKFLLYADDLKVYNRISSINDVHDLQNDINKVVRWTFENGLTFNTDKCYHMSYYRCHSPLLSSYKIQDFTLKTVNEINDLGVIFDSDLCFINHLNFIIPKAYSVLAFIRRNSADFSDAYTRKLLYTMFVRPKLEYASFIWSPYAAIHINRLEKVQVKFIKFALQNINYHDPMPSYANRCNLIHLQTLESRRMNSSLLFIHGLISGSIDCPLLLSFIKLRVPVYALRYHEYFFVKSHRTEYGKNEPIDRALILYNSLTFDCQYCKKCKHCLLDFSLNINDFKNMLLNFSFYKKNN